MSVDLAKEILQAKEEGKVLFMTIEGLAEAKLDDLLDQPVESLLYDLNRDSETLVSRIAKGDVKSINDYALTLVVKRLYEELDQLRGQVNEG